MMSEAIVSHPEAGNSPRFGIGTKILLEAALAGLDTDNGAVTSKVSH